MHVPSSRASKTGIFAGPPDTHAPDPEGARTLCRRSVWCMVPATQRADRATATCPHCRAEEAPC